LPEFVSLSGSDRQSLLASALPRLVVLYMAEKNLQFAVTSAHDDDPHLPMDCDQLLPAVTDQLAELPTQQFVEGIQNLIRKCQLLQVNANEFFYMRMITLFHTGLYRLTCSECCKRLIFVLYCIIFLSTWLLKHRIILIVFIDFILLYDACSYLVAVLML